MDMLNLELFGGITILNSAVKSYQYAPHWHDDYVFAVYRGGAKHYRCERQTGDATAGDVLVIAPGTLHSATTFDTVGWDYQALYIKPDQLTRATGLSLKDLEARFKDFTKVGGRPALARSFTAFLDADTGAELALSEWLLALPCTAPKASTKASAGLSAVRERIMDDPVSIVSLAELSDLAQITPEHLCRSFKRAYGLSPFQLVTAGRIHKAFQHIQTGKSLVDAAVLSGFSDQSHMTRWFKRTYGVSPRYLARDQ